MSTKIKYWLLLTDIEQWTGNLILEWIPLENAKNKREALIAAERWLQKNRDKVYYFESNVVVEVVERIQRYSPNEAQK